MFATKKEEKTIMARCNRGAKVLDKIEPKWFKKIKIKSLNMDSFWDCIIGQLYQDTRYLDDKGNVPEALRNVCWHECGFDDSDANSSIVEEPDYFQNLQTCWLKLIRERKTTAKLVTV